MGNFYIDFSGFCRVEAEDYEGARQEFWELLASGTPLPYGIFEIEGVEKQKDGD